MRGLMRWAVCLGLLVAARAEARLGESVAGVERRLGKPAVGVAESEWIEEDRCTTYYTETYEIYVVYIDGKSALESYERRDGKALSDAEIATIAEKNGVAALLRAWRTHVTTGKQQTVQVGSWGWLVHPKTGDGFAIAERTPHFVRWSAARTTAVASRAFFEGMAAKVKAANGDEAAHEL